MRQPYESGTRVQGTPTTSIAAVSKWCHQVRNCNFACTGGVKSTLDSLHHIYKNL